MGFCTTVDERSEKHVKLDNHQYNENNPVSQSFEPFKKHLYDPFLWIEYNSSPT